MFLCEDLKAQFVTFTRVCRHGMALRIHMHVLNWLKSLKMTFLQMLRNLTHWALGFFNLLQPGNLLVSHADRSPKAYIKHVIDWCFLVVPQDSSETSAGQTHWA